MSSVLSCGEHLHAYTRDSFFNLVSLFDNICINRFDTVIEGWSFGFVISKNSTKSCCELDIIDYFKSGLNYLSKMFKK